MKEWMIKTATILFDDSKNDLGVKTVRLQLLYIIICMVNSIYLYVYGQVYAHIWTSLVVGHIAIIFETLIIHLNNFIIFNKTNINGVIIVMVEA